MILEHFAVLIFLQNMATAFELSVFAVWLSQSTRKFCCDNVILSQSHRNEKKRLLRVVIINQDLTIISHSHNDLIIVTINCMHLDRALEADALISWLFETC